MERLAGIQDLRAIAAMGVVLFHATEPFGIDLRIGAAGVDIFFVISGFVMWRVQATRPRRPLTFLADRAVRILPSYWLATLCLLLLAQLGLLPRMVVVPEHLLASFLFLPWPSPSVPGLTLPFLGQGWTLNYEMAFYLLFAIAISFSASRRFAVIAAVLVGAVVSGWLLRPGSVADAFYTRPIILEFLAGIVVAQCYQARLLASAVLGAVLALAGAAGFLLLALLGGESERLACGVAATALVAGVVALETAGRLPRLPGLLLLGDASYPLYIWHSFVLSVVFRLGEVLHLAAWLTVSLALVGSAAAGVVIHYVMERPIAALARRVRSAPAGPPGRMPSHAG